MKKLLITILIILMSISLFSCNKVDNIISSKIEKNVNSKIDNIKNDINENLNSEEDNNEVNNINTEVSNINDNINDNDNKTIRGRTNSQDTNGDDFYILDIKTDYILNNYIFIDDDYLKATAKKLEYLGYGDFSLKLEFKNKTDKDLAIYSDCSGVNGYMIPSGFYDILPANKKIIKEMYFTAYDLRMANISSIEEIAFILNIEDASEEIDDDSLILINKFVKIYPTGRSHEEILIEDKPKYDLEIPVVDEQGFEFTILEEKIDENGNYVIKYYIYNYSDDDINFYITSGALNEIPVDYINFSTDIFSKFRLITERTIYKNTLDELGIESVDKIELNVNVRKTTDNFEPFFSQGYVIE